MKEEEERELDVYQYSGNNLPTIGLLYFLYLAEHLFPKQARLCDKVGQRFPPGEGCWETSLVRDWIPFPQLRSQDDHIDHLETSQLTTRKTINWLSGKIFV